MSKGVIFMSPEPGPKSQDKNDKQDSESPNPLRISIENESMPKRPQLSNFGGAEVYEPVRQYSLNN